MLSVGAMAAGQGAYYADLAQEDYYFDGGEPPGLWMGEGAEELGLFGKVSSAAFKNLFRGMAPDGKSALVQIQKGRRARQPGWDLTFSAPKSVSVLWATAHEGGRRAIQQAHHAAVKAAVDFLQDTAAFTRRGSMGRHQEAAALVAAAFEHGTSRAQDPQLHTHLILLNLGVRVDGTTGTILSRPLYKAKMAAGALYRAELGHRLQKLGVGIEKDRDWFRVKGVPKELEEHFSTRSAQIREAASKHGWKSAKAMEKLCLTTRTVKEHLARGELVSLWQEAAAKHGLTAAAAEQLFGKELGERAPGRAETAQQPQAAPAAAEARRAAPTPRPGRAATAVAAKAIQKINASQSHFTKGKIIGEVARALAHRGLGADQIRAAVDKGFRDAKVIDLGVFRDERHYTTSENLRAEKAALAIAERGRRATGQVVSDRALASALKVNRTINDEQRAALAHITQNPGSIQCVSGMAGTGKTFLLGAARHAWEKAGLEVVGVALAAQAARELREGTGIESTTIRMFEILTESSVAKAAKHHAWQLARAALGKPTFKQGGLEIGKKTVIVVDEAGMVGTRQMLGVLAVAARRGAKVVLVGDERQLQPIEAGAIFLGLTKLLGCVRLVDIQRQKQAWMRAAVHDFANGRASEGLSKYVARGHVHLAENGDDAIRALVASWNEKRGPDLTETLIIASTNDEVSRLNAWAQGARIDRGELTHRRSVTAHGTRYHVGDRVVVTKNKRRLGVLNGDFGTIKKVTPGTLLRKPSVTIQLQQQESFFFGRFKRATLAEVPLDDGLVKLGYAVTTHKAQGATVDQTFLLGGGWMTDRELGYVQMSRARLHNEIHVDVETAGEDLTQYITAMQRSRQKDLAHDVLDAERREQSERAIHKREQDREREKEKKQDRETPGQRAAKALLAQAKKEQKHGRGR